MPFGNKTRGQVKTDIINNIRNKTTEHSITRAEVSDIFEELNDRKDKLNGFFNPLDNLFYEEDTFVTPIVGDAGKLFVDNTSKKIYEFNGTIFTVVSDGGFSGNYNDLTNVPDLSLKIENINVKNELGSSQFTTNANNLKFEGFKFDSTEKKIQSRSSIVLLDSQMEEFQSPMLGLQIVKTYTIPPNTIINPSILIVTFVGRRITGTGNPLISLQLTPNDNFINNCADYSARRHILINGLEYRCQDTSGFFKGDVESQNTSSFSARNIDTTQVITLKLIFNFSVINQLEHRKEFILIQQFI